MSKVLLSVCSLLTDPNPRESRGTGALAASCRARFWWGCAPLPTPPHPTPSPLPPEDPLVGSIAQQLLADREAHDKSAAEWTRRYAQG